MLLAVEGGGFFSSLSSGYSNGLTLLLFGQTSEVKPMRVLPLNQYQLVDREPDLNIQLASTKTWISWGCASFRCFRQTSAGPDSSFPLKKAATTQRQDGLRTSAVSDNGKNHIPDLDDNSIAKKVVLKSSLKKASDTSVVSERNADEHKALGGKVSYDSNHIERRKVQWTDTCGSELAQVKEFEPSEINASDDEIDLGKRCLCTIM